MSTLLLFAKKCTVFLNSHGFILSLMGMLSFVAVFASVALTQQQQDLRQRAQVDPYGICTATQTYTCVDNKQYYCPSVGSTPSIIDCLHGCDNGRCNAAPTCNTTQCPNGCNSDNSCNPFCNKTCGTNERCLSNASGGTCLANTPTPTPTSAPITCTTEGQKPSENQGQACCSGLTVDAVTKVCRKPTSGTGGFCTSNAQCSTGLRCTSGRCETIPTPTPTPVNNRPNGTFCSTNSVCLSGYCDIVALKCADQPANYCTKNADCSANFRCSAQNRCEAVTANPTPRPNTPMPWDPERSGEICGSLSGCVCSNGPDTGKRVDPGGICRTSATASQVGTLCSPSARLSCIGTNGLRMCNSTGTGYTDITCAPGNECRDTQCQRIQSEPTQTPPATTSNKIIDNGQTCTGSIFDKCQCGDKTINSGQICVLAATLPSTNRADGAFCSLNSQCTSNFCNTVELKCATKPTDYCVLNTQCSTDGSIKCIQNTCVDASTVVSVSVNDFLRIPEGSICYGNTPCVCNSGPDIGKTISPGGVCTVTPSNYVASTYTGPYAGQVWLDRTVALIEQGHTLDPVTYGVLALYQGYDLLISGQLSTASNSVAFADEQCANPNVTAAECIAHRLGQVGNIALAAFDVATLGLSGFARNSADNVATSVVRNLDNTSEGIVTLSSNVRGIGANYSEGVVNNGYYNIIVNQGMDPNLRRQISTANTEIDSLIQVQNLTENQATVAYVNSLSQEGQLGTAVFEQNFYNFTAENPTRFLSEFVECGYMLCGEQSLFTQQILESRGTPAQAVYVGVNGATEINHAVVEAAKEVLDPRSYMVNPNNRMFLNRAYQGYTRFGPVLP